MYDQNPKTNNQKIQQPTDNTKNATNNFDYKIISDRLRTISWSINNLPTGVVKPVYRKTNMYTCTVFSLIFAIHYAIWHW